MSSLNGAISYEFIWHTLDVDACTACLQLEGETWRDSASNGIVMHPVFGAIYDLQADTGLIHPNCRCFLEINPLVDLEKTEVYQFAQKILEETGSEMPSNIDDATKKLETLRVETVHTTGVLRELEYVFYRTTSVLRRMGLPEDINRAIAFVQKMILTLRVLHMTVTLLEMSTPYGWALGILSGLGAAATASDLALSIGE